MRPLSLSDFPVPSEGHVFIYNRNGRLVGWLPDNNPEIGDLQQDGMIVW